MARLQSKTKALLARSRIKTKGLSRQRRRNLAKDLKGARKLSGERSRSVGQGLARQSIREHVNLVRSMRNRV